MILEPLFYNEDLSEYTFSIYENRYGFSFGYFYCYGGGLLGISDSIRRFDYDGKGSIFLSLNKVKVARIEIDNGVQQPEVIAVDPEKPFSVIIPEDSGEIRVYDIEGNSIPLGDIPVEKISIGK